MVGLAKMAFNFCVDCRFAAEVRGLTSLMGMDGQIFDVTESVTALVVTFEVSRDRKHANFGC